ncbi:MAG TPA: preprotein translocase subunit YajC [Firmicutes bacterium]|jgi:preprotein translocase subunit YajC|nr:preprotein translocase subunit YajC [Bacillota bacterium]
MNFLLAAVKPATTGNSGLIQILILVGFFAIFYFLMIAPQRKQQKQRQAMLGNLKKGDKVITAGGLHGEIVEIDDEDVRLKVADKIELKFSRSSVSKVKN